MLPVLLGLFSAMVFGIVSHGIYGTDDIMAHAWIDMVFWGLIGAGALVSFSDMLWECLPCRLSRLVHAERLQDYFCRHFACVTNGS